MSKGSRIGVLRPIALCAAACLAASMLMPLSGCVFSDTITEKVYEQNDDLDTDATAQPLLVNSIEADETTDLLPQLSTDNTNPDKDKTDQNLPRYGGDTSDALVAAPEQKQEEEEEEEPKDPVKKPKADPNSTSTRTVAAGAPTEETEEEEEGPQPEEGDGEDDGDDGENPDNEGDDPTDVGGGTKNEKNEKKVYEDFGEFAEVPEEVTHVTAVGDAAIIVSMLGGTKDETPLVGADADFVENETIQKVLANKGVSKVKTFWKNDGTGEDDLIDLDKIIKSETELCFVMEGDDTLSKKQQNELVDNDILVYVIPNMTSAAKLTYAVQLVGDILEAGGNEQAGKLRDKYLDFHDDLVKELKNDNGGLAGDLNFDTGKKNSDPAKKTIYSLYISDWDHDAVYDDKNGGYIKSNQGVGISRVGYEDSPMPYYMSVGGVVNNASTGSWQTLSGYTSCVWQFSQTQATSAWKQWTTIDRSKINYMTPASDGLTWCLTWNDDDSVGLGCDEYPGVIVKTQQMKTWMETDAARKTGLYHPYPLTEGSQGGVVKVTMVGYYSGSNLVKASIGTSGQGLASTLNTSELGSDDTWDLYDIYVNPQGMFSSWADGSVESVLESAWIYKTFVNSDYELKSTVKSFYNDFYDYDINSDEIDAILAGPEK